MNDVGWKYYSISKALYLFILTIYTLNKFRRFRKIIESENNTANDIREPRVRAHWIARWRCKAREHKITGNNSVVSAWFKPRKLKMSFNNERRRRTSCAGSVSTWNARIKGAREYDTRGEWVQSVPTIPTVPINKISPIIRLFVCVGI